MLVTRSFVFLSAVALLGMVGAASVQAGGQPNQDYVISFWNDTQDDAHGRYTAPDGGQWFIGRSDQDPAEIFTSASTGAHPLFSGPTFDSSNNEWSYLNPGSVGGSVNASGNAYFTSNLTLETGGILNQFPRAVLIFQAPVDGLYSVRGTARWDWAGNNQGGAGIANPGQISQLRFDFSTWASTDLNDPAMNWDLCAEPTDTDCRTTLASNSDLGFKTFSQDSEVPFPQEDGTGTLDLATVAELQDIPLNAGEFLGIQSGSRGILSLVVNPPGFEVYDTSVMNLNVVPEDPVRIFGPVPEPATISLLALGGLALLRRSR